MSMMRLSGASRLNVVEVQDQKRRRQVRNHDALFDAVVANTSADDRRGGLLFVGGCQPADMAVRLAQVPQRHDRSPGRFSHVGLVLDWPDGARPDQVLGLECALEPLEPRLSVPERNGVTRFHLGRYRDRRWHPNMAFATICLPQAAKGKANASAKGKGKGGAAGAAAAVSPDGGPLVTAAFKERLRQMALRPADDRGRYPLWEWLGAWHAFVHGVGDNPLARDIGHPGAAFCEFVYRSLGIDLSPGAMTPSASPEVLWSTLLWWHDRLTAEQGQIKVWASWTDPDSLSRVALSSDLTEELSGSA